MVKFLLEGPYRLAVRTHAFQACNMGSIPIRDVIFLSMGYQENIFTKIIKKEVKVEILLENENAICFKDINPKSKIHYIIIPKTFCSNFTEFERNTPSKQKLSFWAGVSEAIEKLNLSNGYRLITNTGKDAKQEIPHFHVHILGGQELY